MTDVPFWGSDFAALQSEDPEIAGILLSELERTRGGLQLIASENLTSPAVLAALGSVLSNKYAEGYPGRRYYGGCAEVDKAEILGIERAKSLFDADHACTSFRSKHRRLRRLHEARRNGIGDEPSAWWTPDPRHQGFLLRQVVQRSALWGQPDH
jgi:hypothetical protein